MSMERHLLHGERRFPDSAGKTVRMLLRAASGASGHGIRRAPNHAAAQIRHGQAIGGGAVAQAPVHVRSIFPQRDGEAVAFTAEGAGKGQDAAYRHIDGGELALDGVLDGLAGGGRGRGIGQSPRRETARGLTRIVTPQGGREMFPVSLFFGLPAIIFDEK